MKGNNACIDLGSSWFQCLVYSMFSCHFSVFTTEQCFFHCLWSFLCTFQFVIVHIDIDICLFNEFMHSTLIFECLHFYYVCLSLDFLLSIFPLNIHLNLKTVLYISHAMDSKSTLIPYSSMCTLIFGSLICQFILKI